MEDLRDEENCFYAKILVNIYDVDSMSYWWDEFKVSSSLHLSKIYSKMNPMPSAPFLATFKAVCRCQKNCPTYTTLYLQKMDAERENKLYRRSNAGHQLVVKLYLTHRKY